MDIKPKIDIIIPCYNVERAIDLCIKGLIVQSYHEEKFHCYFVDDASTDKTTEILESYSNHPQISVITHSTNKGLSAARNTGIKNSSAEMVCFLDGDMEVKQDWLDSFLPYFDSENIIAVMGDNVMPKVTPPNIFEKYYFSHLRGARQFEDGNIIPPQLMLYGNAMIKRNILNNVGFFDETFSFYGGEDTDFSFRIWETFPEGFRISKKSNSVHHHPRTLSSFCLLMEHYGRHNLPILLSRYPQFEEELAGDWIHTIKGYLIFNPFIQFILSLIQGIYPAIIITRYKVIYAVLKGARLYYKKSSKKTKTFTTKYFN